ncbi:taste receptor type 2 member 40-like [Lithobates pipiens]
MKVFNVLYICMSTLGIVLNMVILICYFRDWRKGKALTVCDQILLSMAFIGIALQWSFIAQNLMFSLKPCDLWCKEAYLYVNINYIITVFFINTSFWQTALLSTYYCVKLCDVSRLSCQWMDRMISSSTLWLLLGSAAFSFLITISFFWRIHLISPGNVTEPAEMRSYIWSLNISDYLLSIMFGCCLPFLVNFICIALSVGSLVKHVCRIRKNIVQSSSSSLIGGPVRAVITMVLCAMLDIVYCVDFVGQVLSNFNNVVNAIGCLIFILYPIMRPIVIIIGNPQFKRRLVEMCFDF